MSREIKTILNNKSTPGGITILDLNFLLQSSTDNKQKDYMVLLQKQTDDRSEAEVTASKHQVIKWALSTLDPAMWPQCPFHW